MKIWVSKRLTIFPNVCYLVMLILATFFSPSSFASFINNHTSRMRERSEHLLWWLCVGVCICWFNKCWMLSFAFVFHDHQKHFELSRAHFDFFSVVATSSFKFEFFPLTIFVYKFLFLNALLCYMFGESSWKPYLHFFCVVF